MILIAAVLDRKLILPWLFSFGEDGSTMQFVEFDAVYDGNYIVEKLAELGVRSTVKEPNINTRPTFVQCSHKPEVDTTWYERRYGKKISVLFYNRAKEFDVGNSTSVRLHMDWPPGSYSQTTMLNMHEEPLRVAQIRRVFLFAPRIRERAAKIAAAVRKLGDGATFGCLHLRVEVDWKKHAMLSAAHMGGAASGFWVDAADVASRISEAPLFANVSARVGEVYILTV